MGRGQPLIEKFQLLGRAEATNFKKLVANSYKLRK
jgi:hypothetical protein